MKKRQEQQRDSDLEMLVRAPHGSAQAMASQIMFLLARHKQNPPSIMNSGDRSYKTLRSNILRLDVPNHDGDVKNLMERMSQIKLWLNGMRGQSSAYQVAKDLLVESLSGPEYRGDWASKLMDVYEGLAWITSGNLGSCQNMRPPVSEKLKSDWSGAVGKMIGQVLRKNALIEREGAGEDSQNRLGVVSMLWKADGCQWVADPAQWDLIQTIGTDRVPEAHLQDVETFISFQKRHQLSKKATVNVAVDGVEDTMSHKVNTSGPKL